MNTYIAHVALWIDADDEEDARRKLLAALDHLNANPEDIDSVEEWDMQG